MKKRTKDLQDRLDLTWKKVSLQFCGGGTMFFRGGKGKPNSINKADGF